MGLFDSKDEKKVADAANDKVVQSETEKHAEEYGVPSSDESPELLNDEQMEKQDNAGESSESEDSGESEDTEENKSPSLVVKPYEGEKEEGEEEEEIAEGEEVEGEKESQNEESDLESDEDDNFLSRMALGLENENEDNASKKAGKKIGPEEMKEIDREYKRNVSKDDRSWQTALHSARYKDSSGETTNLFKPSNTSTLDKVQKKINLTSSVASIASSGVGVFEENGFLGKKIGVGEDTSKKLNKSSAGLSLASDALSLASGGISVYKGIQDMKNNDEFTTDAEKTKQRLSLASNIIGMGSTSTSMGKTISELAGGETTSTAFGAATNTLNVARKALDISNSAISLKESNASMGKLKAAMNDDKSSEEFKKMAGVAMQAHKLQKTSAGFDIAKSSASLISNLTGAAKKFADLAGVEENSTLGKVFKYAGKAGTYIGYLGTGLGFIGSIVKKAQKSKRKDSDIDSFIDTPKLKDKINSVTNYNLNIKQTRKVAMSILGYKDSNEMYSAILMNYAATIRKKADSGDEKDKYRMLIESLGFKLQGNSNLPSIEAIAKKLSASA